MLQRKHDKVYQWKALRMVSRESLPIFARTALEGDLEEAARGFFPNETPPAPPPAAKKVRLPLTTNSLSGARHIRREDLSQLGIFFCMSRIGTNPLI